MEAKVMECGRTEREGLTLGIVHGCSELPPLFAVGDVCCRSVG